MLISLACIHLAFTIYCTGLISLILTCGFFILKSSRRIYISNINFLDLKLNNNSLYGSSKTRKYYQSYAEIGPFSILEGLFSIGWCVQQWCVWPARLDSGVLAGTEYWAQACRAKAYLPLISSTMHIMSSMMIKLCLRMLSIVMSFSKIYFL